MQELEKKKFNNLKELTRLQARVLVNEHKWWGDFVQSIEEVR